MNTYTHLCVVGEGVFLQGNFDILMFGALLLTKCHALHSVSSLTY